jgi:hypothetical protein
LQPFPSQERFHGTANDLAADGAVIILNAFLRVAFLIGESHTPLQAGIAMTAVAGDHFDAIQGGDDAALHAAFVKRVRVLKVMVRRLALRARQVFCVNGRIFLALHPW